VQAQGLNRGIHRPAIQQDILPHDKARVLAAQKRCHGTKFSRRAKETRAHSPRRMSLEALFAATDPLFMEK
jgi:hypothetical protein